MNKRRIWIGTIIIVSSFILTVYYENGLFLLVVPFCLIAIGTGLTHQRTINGIKQNE